MEWRLTINQIAEATGGRIEHCDGDEIVKDVSKDSRQVIEGGVYVALNGETYNGHRFARQAVENGAVCCVVEEGETGLDGLPVVYVGDTYQALRDIAAYYRMLFDIPVVGITGSVGKTSTKEMVAGVLAQRYQTHKTEGNFNNEVGVPLTVFRISDADEISVIEMGMSARGEISRLTRIARPDTAIITNIGVSHIEHLGSRDNILKAKLEILEGLPSDGTVILNGDDELLCGAIDDIEYETLSFGIENQSCDIVARTIKAYSDSSEFTVKVDGNEYRVLVNAPGKHHIYNALAAILVGLKYGIDMAEIIQGIRDFLPGGLRQNVLEFDRYTIIKDCYNASPSSMKAGLEVLGLMEDSKDRRTRKVACLADMLELGDYSRQAHLDVGRLAVEYGVECLITVGEMAAYIAAGAEEAGLNPADIHTFKNNSELTAQLAGILKTGDIILVKGSRGMRLEEIADYIGTL